MIGPRQLVQTPLHALALADIARNTQNLGRFLGAYALHQAQRRFEPYVILVSTTRAIDDRWLGLALGREAEGDPDDFVIFGVYELQQRMSDQLRVRQPENAF